MALRRAMLRTRPVVHAGWFNRRLGRTSTLTQGRNHEGKQVTVQGNAYPGFRLAL